MQLYELKIDKAIDYLLSPGILNATGDSPVCYVTYDTKDAVEIMRLVDSTLAPKARHYGFDVKIISIKDLVFDFITSHPYYEEAWLLEDEFPESDIFDSIRTEFQDSNYLANAILRLQDEYRNHGRPLMVFTDLEWLHPFDKIGRVEQVIYKKIELPMLILYPGQSQGTARTFLNIYPMDGNYRSKNF